MLIAGAGGFARQILATLNALGQITEVVFYDDYSPFQEGLIPRHFRVLSSEKEAAAYFEREQRFILGTGNPLHRSEMCRKLESLGGKVFSLIDPTVRIAPFDTDLDPGVTVLQDVILEPGVQIGKGVLLNVRAVITHDCIVGEFSEISPGAMLLGASRVGSFCMIGAGAIILKGIEVGDYAVIGAGAVVTKNVGKGETWAGVPATQIKKT
jgi:sugar O-acyltransferase (sialic acid O-acetyltransferase NeuD family)